MHGVLTRKAAVESGITDRALLDLCRSGAIARAARGVYSIGGAELPDPLVVSLAHRVVLSHQTAAAWWGADLPAPVGELHVTASRNRGRRRDDLPGCRLHRADLHGDVATLHGARVTTPLRTALDVCRQCSLEEAVVIVDSLLREELLVVDRVVAAADRTRGPGSQRVRRAISLVDPLSGSALESLVRIVLWRHGIASPTTQYFLRDPSSGWSGRLDFAWPQLRVALETDGHGHHASRSQFERDRRRWSALNRLGWKLGVVTWADVANDPEYIAALVRDLLDSAAASAG